MLFLDAFKWILDPEHWATVNFGAGILDELAAHLWLTLISVVVTSVIALPIGLYIGHTGRGRRFAILLANVARAFPTLGLLSLLLSIAIFSSPDAGVVANVLVFVLLGVPPLLAGAYAGLESIDRRTIDAARAMGHTEWQILRRVELPLAAPLILGGLRSAVLQIIASVTIVSYFGTNSLGDFILAGLASRDYVQVVAGSLLVTALALLVDGLLAVVQRTARPRGVSRGRDRTTTARGRTASSASRAPMPEGN
jgi:osmoprotectant transport system permease protein